VADNNEDVSREFNEFVKRLVEGNQDAANDLEKAFKVIGKHAGSFGKELNDLDRAAEGVTEASKKEEKSKSNLTLATEQLVALTKRFGSAMVSSEQGVGKYGGAVEGVTDTIASMTSKLGLLGVVAGELIKVFGGLVALGLKNNDEYLKTYNTLSDVGVRFTNIVDEFGNYSNLMQELKIDTGSSSENLAFFANTLRGIAPDLGAFGGSITAGGKNFEQVVKHLLTDKDNFFDFKALGVTEQEIIKFAGLSIANQTKFGKLESNNIADVTAKTKEYIEQLTELSQLTGQSKDVAQQKIQEQQASLDFQIYLQKLRESGPNGPALAQQASNAMLLMQEQVGTTMSAAAMSLIANGGRATTELAANYQRLLLPTIVGFQNVVRGGGNAFLGMADVLKKQTLPALAANNRANRETALASNEAGAALGTTLQTMEAENKLRNMSSVLVAKANLEEAKRKGDPKVIKAAQAEYDSMIARQKLDKLADSTFETSMDIIKKFTDMLDNASYGLAKFVKFITFGKIDFTDLWRTIESTKDANTVIDEEAQTKKELEKEKNELQEKYNKAVKEKIDSLEKLKANGYGPGIRAYDEDVKTFNQKINEIRADQRDNELALYKSKQLVEKANKYLALEKKEDENKQSTDTTPAPNQTNNLPENKPTEQKPNQTGLVDGLTINEFAKKYNIPIGTYGGFRTHEQQEQLYKNRGNNPNPVAEPGASKHETGQAIDVPTEYLYKHPEIRKLLQEKGFTQPFPKKDPVHWELTNPPMTSADNTNDNKSAPTVPVVNQKVDNQAVASLVQKIVEDATAKANKVDESTKPIQNQIRDGVNLGDLLNELQVIASEISTLIDVSNKIATHVG